MSTTAGIGGNNWVYVVPETTYGTYIDPATGGGAWVPVLSENLVYTTTNYYSKQIRQQTIDSDVEASYYHIAGDIVMEVDANYMPYFLYASRHTVVKTGSGPYVYSASPASFGSTYPGGTAPGVSITVDRNGNGFGYSGCVVTKWMFEITDGVLRVTMSILGLAEQLPAGLGSPTWLAPSLFGATAHRIFEDTAGATPTFATPATNFNGFTATFDYNGAPQNRIVANRAATFISYGETAASYDTELDFLDRTDYDDFVAVTTRSIKMESVKPTATAWASVTEGFRIIFYNAAFDAYEVDTTDIGTLVMAKVTGHGLQQTGGVPFVMECTSALSLS